MISPATMRLVGLLVIVGMVAGCGKRHRSVLVDVVVHVRVVDAQNGTGIEGAEVLVGGVHVESPEWRAKQVAEHRLEPEYRLLGLSGYGLTDHAGNVTISYRLHRSWMEKGLSRGSPGNCAPCRVWARRDGLASRVLKVEMEVDAVRSETGLNCEVRLPDVILSHDED